ncbi:hypothetical protein JB92DRAFT_2890178 [Gautieria morchelliformis]|nr:hypothetical protein JB92DRAFT_2890178 [Gautieria morchelliformis]
MLGIAVILLFISASTCSISIIPLSAPLPNGTMALQCPVTPPSLDTCFDPRVGLRNCCSNDEILGIAVSPCWFGIGEDREWATFQYSLNRTIVGRKLSLCRSL